MKTPITNVNTMIREILSEPMRLPCGGTAYFDESSGISYRCEHCGAVVGSIGQPRKCAEESKKWEAYEKAGMWRWDYNKGESCAVDSKRVSRRHS